MTQTALQALPEELREILSSWLGPAEWSVEPLQGDASVRAYYRVERGGERFVLAYYPAAVRAGLGLFVRAYEAISPCTRVPTLVRSGEFATLQDDVGDTTLFDLLHADRNRGLLLYEAAIDLLVDFQTAPCSASSLNPAFDARKFEDELEMSLRYYVKELRGVKDPGVHRELSEIFSTLAKKVASHPFVLCHRDYHGQNLHVKGDALYMIDYQDLRMGPDTYDIASLLRDRGVARLLGTESEKTLIDRYRERIKADDTLYQRYDECLLQRTIKILGTFAAQAVTRGKTHYLDFIPPAVETLRECLARLPEFGRLAEIFPMNEEGR